MILGLAFALSAVAPANAAMTSGSTGNCGTNYGYSYSFAAVATTHRHSPYGGFWSERTVGVGGQTVYIFKGLVWVDILHSQSLRNWGFGCTKA